MHVINISVLSHHNDVLATKLKLNEAHVCKLKAWLDEAKVRLDASEPEAHHQLSDAMLDVSNAHATICNSKNQGLLPVSREDWDVQETQNKHGGAHHHPP